MIWAPPHLVFMLRLYMSLLPLIPQVLLSSDPSLVVQHLLRMIGDGDVTALLNQCRNGGLMLSPIEAYFFTDVGLELEWRRRLFWSSLCAKINKVERMYESESIA